MNFRFWKKRSEQPLLPWLSPEDSDILLEVYNKWAAFHNEPLIEFAGYGDIYNSVISLIAEIKEMRGKV